MGIISRATRIVRQAGLTGLLMKGVILAYDRWFDFRYGVDTCRRQLLSEMKISSGNRKHGNKYEPSRVLPVRRFLKMIAPTLPQPAVLVDIGSGKGRILLIASQFGFASATGVEFAEELCEIARSNCRIMSESTGTSTKFQIVHGDATAYPVGQTDNTFFFFNPFDDVVMKAVLENITASVTAWPRRIVLCLYNPPSTDIIDRSPAFTKDNEFTILGYHFIIYGNRSDSIQS